MKFRHVAGALAAGIAACMLAAGSALAQQPIVVKFSHVVATDTPKGKGAEKFKELAEKRLPGKVKVEVYPNSTLYKDKEEMEALQLGAVQMLAPSLAKFGPLGVKEFEAFDFPYIFDDTAELHRITQGPIGASLLAKLEPKGIKGLAFWDNGFKSFSANTPIKAPADLKGKKLRIQSSKVLEEQIRSVGGLPQVMAFSEVYQALQTGVVDGQENTWSNIYSQKFHEVQKTIAETNHGVIDYMVVTNSKWWDGLPADVKKGLSEAMAEATAYSNKLASDINETDRKKIADAGKAKIQVLSKEDVLAWRKAMEPVWKKFEGDIGRDLIDAALKSNK